MRILLIYPTKLDRAGNPIRYRKAFLPPLSLAILNSLTPDVHDISVKNDIVEDINYEAEYDLVCITAMTSQANRAYAIADRFRDSGVKVVLGGIHASILPEEAKQHADSVIIGEAEDLWETVLSDLEHNRQKDFYRCEAPPDLSKKVIPKWDGINLDIYPKPLSYKLPRMPIYTTRGCPYGCRFCSVTSYFGKSYRVKPIAHVLEEIESVKAESYFFVDDNIVCNPAYARELMQALSEKKIRWFSQISTTVVKQPDLVDLLAKAGCTGLLIGIESLNPSNLKSVGKSFNKIEEYEELFKLLRTAGIKPFPSIIFGLDNDNEETFEETLRFLIKMKVTQAVFLILTPLPGTEMYDELKRDDRILSNDWSLYDLNNVVYQPKNMSVEELQDRYWQTYQKFYSIKNISERILRRLSFSPDALRAVLSGIFYGYYFRKIVYSKEHPFSGGIGRIKS